MWHVIDIGKVDQSKSRSKPRIVTFTSWMQELQQIVKLDCKSILNYLCCERRYANEVLLITEMITRGSLSNYLTSFKHPRMRICQAWFRQILTGLECIHARHITHGHLSCSHVYINSNTGELKIGDLSLVKLPEILADRLTFHRPVDDIHHFGLVALEIAFAQVLTPKGLRHVMDRLYDSPNIDKDRVQKYLCYIEDPTYRSLISAAVFADSGVAAGAILKHKFFTTEYGKDEVLRTRKRLGSQMPTRNVSTTLVTLPPKHPGVEVKRSTIVPTNSVNSNIMNVTVRIVNGDITRTIDFQYDLASDTPERVAQEMRAELPELPESYVHAVRSQLEDAGTPLRLVLSPIVVRTYEMASRTENKSAAAVAVGVQESESEHTENTARKEGAEDKQGYYASQTQTHSFIPGTISPIDNASVVSASTNQDYLKMFYTSRGMSNPPQGSKPESRKDILQPEVSFSDVQCASPRNDADEDIIGTGWEEGLAYLPRLFMEAGCEEPAEGSESERGRKPPTI